MHVSSRPTRGPRWRYVRCAGARSTIVRIAALAAVLAAVIAPFSAQPAAASHKSYVDTDVLNLRDDAGTWANIITQMYQDETVTVLDGPTDDGWYYIDYAGQEGWAFGGYLSVYGKPGWDQPLDAGVGGAAATAWVDTDRLNVRVDASTSAWVMDVLGTGAEVSVVGTPVNGFVPIDYYGQRAYVWSDFLSFDGPTEPAAERWIDVNRTTQMVTLYEGDEAVASYWGAMGWDKSDDGFFATANGTYYVYAKNRDLTWTDWGQAYIEDWVAFDPSRENGFHAFSMDAKGRVLPNGDGATGGCVALAPDEAEALYDFAGIGTRVEVHW